MIENLNLLHSHKTGLVFDLIQAVDPATRKNYAVKILRESSLQNKKHHEFLKNEWDAIKALKHDNLIKYHYYGKKGKLPYIVMDWIDCQNLKIYAAKAFPKGFREIEKNQLFKKREWVARTLIQMLNVVSYIHSQKIIHLDIKPENFLINGDEEIRLIDFSMSKHGFWGRLKKVNSIAGTPSFISPEQIRKEKLTEASDIYSLGATIYYVLAGHPPYTGRNKTEVLNMHLKAKHQPLYNYIPGLRKPVSDLIDRMLIKNQKNRLANLASIKTEISKKGLFPKLK